MMAGPCDPAQIDVWLKRVGDLYIEVTNLYVVDSGGDYLLKLQLNPEAIASWMRKQAEKGAVSYGSE